jgi:outer membrane protein OmpA-like peptidoglycan-associated protein
VALAVAVACFVALAALWRRAADLESRVVSARRQVEDLSGRVAEAERTLGERRGRVHQIRQQASAAEMAARASESSSLLAQQAREMAAAEAEQAARAAEQARLAAGQAAEEAAIARDKRLQELQDMRRAFNKIMSTTRASHGMDLDLGDGGDLFDPGAASLHPKGKETLSRLSGVLLASHGYRLYFRFPDRQPLLKRRAQAVANYLKRSGLPEDWLLFGRRANGPQSTKSPNTIQIQVEDTILPAADAGAASGRSASAAPRAPTEP